MELLLQYDPSCINLCDQNKWTALHYAAANAHIESIKLLLQYNSDPSLQNNLGNTALHYIATYGNTDIVELLLKHSSDVINVLDQNKCTALHYAATYGNIGSIKLLLKYNSEISNLQDIWGNTALHYAAANGHIESVKLLLNQNLEIKLQDYLYNELNTYEKEVVELFITHAVKLRYFNKDINSKIVTLNIEFIQNSQNLSTLAQKCEQEIQKMQDIKIDSSGKSICSIYLLPNNANVLARYANHLKVLDWYKNSEQEFPIYGTEVARRIKNGIDRKKLLEGACSNNIFVTLCLKANNTNDDSSKSITVINLNDDVTYNIAEYLDNKDLEEIQHKYMDGNYMYGEKCFFCNLSGEEVVDIEN
ncbi:ankyrin repeat family protein [Orientia tsutsugamushi str. Gilliam]